MWKEIDNWLVDLVKRVGWQNVIDRQLFYELIAFFGPLQHILKVKVIEVGCHLHFAFHPQNVESEFHFWLFQLQINNRQSSFILHPEVDFLKGVTIRQVKILFDHLLDVTSPLSHCLH